MKLRIQKTYMNLLKEKAKSIKEPKLEYLYDNHLNQAMNLFNIGKSNNRDIFFRDSISRANKVFEGIIRLLYDLAKSLDGTVKAKRNDVYNFIKELINKGKIPNIFGKRLDDYRDLYRNPETHEIFRDFGENKAKTSLNEAFIFFNIGLDIFDLIRNNRVPLNDKDYFQLIFQTFIESFVIYSEFFQLYEKRYNGIYVDNIDVLLELIEDYYKNSLFCREFTMVCHEITNKLRPRFKISLGNNEITFTVIKISDYDLAHKTKVLEIKDRVDKYISTFNNLYFLIWSFTKRKALNQILGVFQNIPHFHLSGLEKPYKNINSFF